MNNEKLNVDRCWNASAPDVDDLACHRWRALPYIEMTEHGPIAWHCCERCPARALHDPETEDGFEAEPVVVYPPSCFEPVVCAVCGAKAACRGSYDGSPEAPACDTCCGHGCEDGRCEPLCGCPAKASGETVHHEGCDEFQASVEAIARVDAPELPSIPGVESRRLEDGRVSLTAQLPRYPDRIELQPEAAIIVHPPTDPAPPSEELQEAMRDPWLDAPLTEDERKAFEAAEHEEGFPWDDDPPTVKRPTPAPAIAS